MSIEQKLDLVLKSVNRLHTRVDKIENRLDQIDSHLVDRLKSQPSSTNRQRRKVQHKSNLTLFYTGRRAKMPSARVFRD